MLFILWILFGPHGAENKVIFADTHTYYKTDKRSLLFCRNTTFALKGKRYLKSFRRRNGKFFGN